MRATRTCCIHPLINLQRPSAENPTENALSSDSAALGAAVGTKNITLDSDLQAIIERWPALTESRKADILVMVKAGEMPD